MISIYVVCDETHNFFLSFYENLFTTLLEKFKVHPNFSSLIKKIKDFLVP